MDWEDARGGSWAGLSSKELELEDNEALPEKEDIAAGELEELGCLLRFSPGDELNWGGNCGEELEVDIRKSL